MEKDGHTFIVMCDPKWEAVEQIDDELVDCLYRWTQEIPEFTNPDMIFLIDSISMATQMSLLDDLYHGFKARGIDLPYDLED